MSSWFVLGEYLNWFKNSEEQIKIVVEKLEMLKAQSPQQDFSIPPIPVTLSKTLEKHLNHDLPDVIEIEVGDLVRYYDNRNPDKLLNVTISATQGSFAEGMVAKNSPLAQALLGLEVGDTTTYSLPSGDVEIEIYEIVKT